MTEKFNLTWYKFQTHTNELLSELYTSSSFSDVVELEVQSRGPSQVPSQIGQKTFLPLGEMDLEQTLKLVMHPHPTPTPPTPP